MIYFEKISFLLLSLLAFVSCTQSYLSPQDTLVTAITSPQQTLDPLFSTSANSQHIGQLVHAGLTKIGTELVPVPHLAKKFRILNNRSIEFTLRKGCLFHNGREITVDDIEKNLMFYSDPENKSPFMKAFQRITRFEKRGPQTFRLHTKDIEPGILTDLSLLKIIPIESYNGEKFLKTPLGAGPYTVTKNNSGGVLLQRFETKCLPLPISPKIHVKVVREDLSRYLKLQKGEIDIILNDLDYRKLQKITVNKVPGVRAIVGKGIAYQYIGLNLANPALKKKKVRQAIAYSLDIPSIIKYKLSGMAVPTASLLSETNWYFNKKIRPLKTNLALAKKLLDEAGYYNGENNKPKLTLSLKTTTNKIVVENATAIKSQLEKSGIIIKHEAFEWGTFYGDVKARNTEMFLLRWVGVTTPEHFFNIFHSGERERNNRTNYVNKELDRYLEIAKGTMNRKKRKFAYDKVQEIVAQDLPYISLWHNNNFVAYRTNLEGTVLFPNGSWQTLSMIEKKKKALSKITENPGAIIQQRGPSSANHEQ